MFTQQILTLKQLFLCSLTHNTTHTAELNSNIRADKVLPAYLTSLLFWLANSQCMTSHFLTKCLCFSKLSFSCCNLPVAEFHLKNMRYFQAPSKALNTKFLTSKTDETTTKLLPEIRGRSVSVMEWFG